MFAGLAILIAVIVIIIVMTIYYSILSRYRQCVTNPTIACYNTWQCETDSGRLGNMTCPGGNCATAIEGLYNNPSPCATGCNPECNCKWNPNTPVVPPTANSAPCAISNWPGINAGTYLCNYADIRCGTDTQPGCNPLCIDKTQPGCCG